MLFLPGSILAVEVAPHISDCEIIEKLVGLKVGQSTLNQQITVLREDMKAGQDALCSEMNHRFKFIDQRFEALKSQYDRIWNLILVVLAGIMGLIGFIIWDQKTAFKPLEKKY